MIKRNLELLIFVVLFVFLCVVLYNKASRNSRVQVETPKQQLLCDATRANCISASPTVPAHVCAPGMKCS
ncbi:MAG TPA: hypothetical protein VLH19_02035 [Patescibacteria group bacterium]|nr:hypothetical protein [Patescibacteria group bacterium]